VDIESLEVRLSFLGQTQEKQLTKELTEGEELAA